MAISFDKLPNERTNNVVPKGFYFGKIVNAEMKKPKDTSKPDYLSLTINLFDKANKKIGCVFDLITESDSSVMQFKLKRLCDAIGLNLAGKTFELKQLIKSLKGKDLILDIKIEDNEQYGARNVVDIFDNSIYYPVSEADSIMGEAGPSLLDMIAAEDADDADTIEDTEFDDI